MTREREIRFPRHAAGRGVLAVFEGGAAVPFDIRRVFTVRAAAGETRGAHAHRRCSQLLVCTSGAIRVWCDDGSHVREYLLDDLALGLLVPPWIWAEEAYLTADAVLMVLCDRVYEHDDYIREYSEFKRFRISE